MRRALVIALVLLGPGTADAATLGREGTELVYRSAPGQAELHMLTEEDGELFMLGGDVTPGEGCSGVEVSCSLAGVTGLRVFLGDGDDRFDVRASLPVTVDGGPGADTVDVSDTERGPVLLTGGPGNDTLTTAGRFPGITLDGGDGDDVLGVAVTGGNTAIDVVCGAGADRAFGEPRDRFGDGCAAAVKTSGPKRVSRDFRAGRLRVPATGTVTLRRRAADSELYSTVLARGAFDRPAGPLRVRLKPTAAGRRATRPRVWVFIQTRTRSDRTEVIFPSRLG